MRTRKSIGRLAAMFAILAAFPSEPSQAYIQKNRELV